VKIAVKKVISVPVSPINLLIPGYKFETIYNPTNRNGTIKKKKTLYIYSIPPSIISYYS
jgi:hypothetical protein